MHALRRLARLLSRRTARCDPAHPLLCNYEDDYYGDRVCGIVGRVRRSGGC